MNNNEGQQNVARRLAKPLVLVVSALMIVILLQSCITTDPQALLDEVNQRTVAASSLEGLAYKPMELGQRNELDFGGDQTPVFEFPGGRSYFESIELPTSQSPYFLVVRSYMDYMDGKLVPLRVATLDKNFEIVRDVGQDRFQWSHYLAKLMMVGNGEAYRQAAMRVEPNSNERYAIVYADPSLAFDSIRLPIRLRGFRRSYPNYEATYWPRGRKALGERPTVEISISEPEDLLISPEEWRPISKFGRNAEAGEEVSTKWFKARAPSSKGYSVRKRKVRTEFGNGDRVEFVSKDYTYRFFVQSEPRASKAAWFADVALESVVAEEFPLNFESFSHRKSDAQIGDVIFKRMDFTGKSRMHFLSPTVGFDLHGVITRPKEDGSGIEKAAIRIGGGMISAPGSESKVDMGKLEEFIRSVELSGSPGSAVSRSISPRRGGSIFYWEQKEFRFFFDAMRFSLDSGGTTLAVGSPGHDGELERAGQARVYRYDGASSGWSQLGRSIDGGSSEDRFGESVTISADGRVVAVGADGYARILRFVSGSWIQMGNSIAMETSTDSFTEPRVSISADGSILAFASSPGYYRSRVHVYQYDGASSDWMRMEGEGDLGREAELFEGSASISLSADGTTLAVGESRGIVANPKGNSDQPGQVRVYEYDKISSKWKQLGGSIDGKVDRDFFWVSVSLSSDGSVLAVGATRRVDHGLRFSKKSDPAGVVRVYRYDEIAGNWMQLGRDLLGRPGGDRFGESVSLSGDGLTLAVGAPHWNVGTGYFRVYDFDVAEARSWSQRGSDIQGVGRRDRFGMRVSLSTDGSVLAVGASDRVQTFDLN